MFEPSIFSRVAKAVDNGAGGSAQDRSKGLVSKPLGQVLKEQFGGEYRANEALKSAIFKDEKLKALGTVDIGALRLVSISERTPVKRNEDTLWLNFLESKEDAKTITDYQYRIKERDILTDVAPIVNIDSTTIFPVLQSAYIQRYNTLTTVGNSLKVSFGAMNLAEQQANVDLMEEQMDDEILRIRRTFSTILMNNSEQVVESPSALPQMGGFYTRSVLNPQNAGGSNFTNTLLQTGINTINKALGVVGRKLMLWTNPNQLSVIRDLMINRFPGENSGAFDMSQATLNAQRLAKYNVPVDMLYKAYPGGSIPVVYDYQMADQTAILFDANLPRLARFKMDGQVGPFVLARPEQTLYELVAVFDIMTLDDPLQVARVKYSGLAS